jgi:hypothetical protein
MVRLNDGYLYVGIREVRIYIATTSSDTKMSTIENREKLETMFLLPGSGENTLKPDDIQTASIGELAHQMAWTCPLPAKGGHIILALTFW